MAAIVKNTVTAHQKGHYPPAVLNCAIYQRDNVRPVKKFYYRNQVRLASQAHGLITDCYFFV